ncbi:hypothetical protein F7725_002448 [Dissostichus mawsoni]|uniref:Uncharacterized protein n=1 Tax=Dissostichus mawsoni TaxID=36200 RepID=A0A7J5Y479_DISMA|nr:hypothetical protein F7725_002448 [Dissostichus mawsoni]
MDVVSHGGPLSVDGNSRSGVRSLDVGVVIVAVVQLEKEKKDNSLTSLRFWEFCLDVSYTGVSITTEKSLKDSIALALLSAFLTRRISGCPRRNNRFPSASSNHPFDLADGRRTGFCGRTGSPACLEDVVLSLGLLIVLLHQPSGFDAASGGGIVLQTLGQTVEGLELLVVLLSMRIVRNLVALVFDLVSQAGSVVFLVVTYAAEEVLEVAALGVVVGIQNGGVQDVTHLALLVVGLLGTKDLRGVPDEATHSLHPVQVLLDLVGLAGADEVLLLGVAGPLVQVGPVEHLAQHVLAALSHLVSDDVRGDVVLGLGAHHLREVHQGPGHVVTLYLLMELMIVGFPGLAHISGVWQAGPVVQVSPVVEVVDLDLAFLGQFNIQHVNGQVELGLGLVEVLLVQGSQHDQRVVLDAASTDVVAHLLTVVSLSGLAHISGVWQAGPVVQGVTGNPGRVQSQHDQRVVLDAASTDVVAHLLTVVSLSGLAHISGVWQAGPVVQVSPVVEVVDLDLAFLGQFNIQHVHGQVELGLGPVEVLLSQHDQRVFLDAASTDVVAHLLTIVRFPGLAHITGVGQAGPVVQAGDVVGVVDLDLAFLGQLDTQHVHWQIELGLGLVEVLLVQSVTGNLCRVHSQNDQRVVFDAEGSDVVAHLLTHETEIKTIKQGSYTHVALYVICAPGLAHISGVWKTSPVVQTGDVVGVVDLDLVLLGQRKGNHVHRQVELGLGLVEVLLSQNQQRIVLDAASTDVVADLLTVSFMVLVLEENSLTGFLCLLNIQ